MINCLLAGVGGQGIVLASNLLTYTYIKKERMVRKADTLGMAQRGGSVVCHVRAGDTIYSPLIPKEEADVILGFEPIEIIRCLNYLKKGGTIIVNTTPILPVSILNSNYNCSDLLSFLHNNCSNVIEVDVDAITNECNSSKVANIALLGAAIGSKSLNISYEEMICTMKQLITDKYYKLNEIAFNIAYNNFTKVNIN